MNKIEHVKKLRALKEEMEQKLNALKEAKQKKKLAEQKNNLSRLFEGELERAQIILAAKDVLERLQKMAEGLAKMTAEDIMPISDNMKGVFGTEVAQTFEQVANDQLASALDAVRSAKEQLNTQVLRMEGKISDEEASAPSNDMMTSGEEGEGDGDDLGLDTGSEEGGEEGEEVPAEGSEGLDDLFGGDEAAAGPEGEPLGRAKKESVESNGKALFEYVNSNLGAAITHIRNDKALHVAKDLADWTEANLPIKSDPENQGSRSLRFDIQGGLGGIILRSINGDDIDATLDNLEDNLSYIEDQQSAKKFMRNVHKLSAYLEDSKQESIDPQKKTLA
jgi:hypothetical protein